ncbi:hypothetical protein CDAR_208011 [Caerostris darwini]|uniref:Ribosomal protein L14 n=1 Tax=Caerostris darwini TaxID=1538125 RepID=A0AAV4U3I0_9ARAC|nr:hypothetical protein CDAR_208011 [Caerostris darwini]
MQHLGDRGPGPYATALPRRTNRGRDRRKGNWRGCYTSAYFAHRRGIVFAQVTDKACRVLQKDRCCLSVGSALCFDSGIERGTLLIIRAVKFSHFTGKATSSLALQGDWSSVV